MIALLEGSRSYGYGGAIYINGSNTATNMEGPSSHKMSDASCFALLVEDILEGP